MAVVYYKRFRGCHCSVVEVNHDKMVSMRSSRVATDVSEATGLNHAFESLCLGGSMNYDGT